MHQRNELVIVDRIGGNILKKFQLMERKWLNVDIVVCNMKKMAPETWSPMC